MNPRKNKNNFYCLAILQPVDSYRNADIKHGRKENIMDNKNKKSTKIVAWLLVIAMALSAIAVSLSLLIPIINPQDEETSDHDDHDHD